MFNSLPYGRVSAVRTLMWVALLACLGTSAGYAPRDGDSDVEAKILATEHMWGRAYLSKDPKALGRILDDAFVNVDSDGILQTKAEVLAEVRASTVVEFLTESMVVHLHGNAAIVTGVFEIKGVERGKHYSQRERFVDTWFYKNGQWVSIAGLVTRIGQ
jgi:ketosteroid isomerase-like protein